MERDKSIIDDDLIRATAQKLWEQRGSPCGTPEEDWYRAEQLLRDEALNTDVSTVEPSPEGRERDAETEPATTAANGGREKKRRARRR